MTRRWGGGAVDGVHVWLAHLARVDALDLSRWLGWLAPDERRKHDRLATAELRREYLVTRALCRWALSRCVPHVAPSEWRFDRSEAGRPFVASPCEAWHFNLSHADGLVACSVSARHRIGVDVEPLARGHELLGNASQLFSDVENEDLRAATDDLRAAHAAALWTSKEAYLKARGEGISLRMNRLSVRPASALTELPDRPARFVLVGDAFGEDPARWQLEVRLVGGDLSALAGAYVLALAIERRPGLDVCVSCEKGLGTIA